MLQDDVDICELLRRGGVLHDVQGSTPQEIYKSACSNLEIPSEITREELYDALCDREQILTTAVGNGIALPHPQYPIIKDDSNQRVFVCYLKEPVSMNALDNKKVFVMFIILSSNVQSHLQIIAKLARLIRKETFKSALEHRAEINVLLSLAGKK